MDWCCLTPDKPSLELDMSCVSTCCTNQRIIQRQRSVKQDVVDSGQEKSNPENSKIFCCCLKRGQHHAKKEETKEDKE